MVRVKFKVPSKEKLAEFVWDLRNSFPPENLAERNNNPCIKIDFSEELVKKILKSDKLNSSLKKEISDQIEFSDKEKKETKEFIKNFEEYWKGELEETFFTEMQKMFGKKYLRKKYICYPTEKVCGAYFGKDEITIVFREVKKSSLNKNEYSSVVLAEEILHLIYWELWQEIYKKEIKDIDEIFEIEGERWSCWHIAEIMPEYLLVENEKFKKFNWHKDDRSTGYPWTIELKKVLDPIWKNSKNIKEFIIKSHQRLNIDM